MGATVLVTNPEGKEVALPLADCFASKNDGDGFALVWYVFHPYMEFKIEVPREWSFDAFWSRWYPLTREECSFDSLTALAEFLKAQKGQGGTP